jgi:hypothetical protein
MTVDEILKIIADNCKTVTGAIKSSTASKSWWIRNNLEDVLDEILKLTHFLPTTAPFTNRVYHIENSIFTPIKCTACANVLIWHKPSGQYRKYCSSKCVWLATKEQRESTNRRKYGVSNPFSSDEIKIKSQDTLTKKYGVTNYSKSEMFKQQASAIWASREIHEQQRIITQRKETCLDVYGTPSPFTNSEVIKKIKDTMISRYGVPSPLQNSDILEKQQNTMLNRYNRVSFQQRHISDSSLDQIKDVAWLKNASTTMSPTEIGEHLGVSYSTICKALTHHNLMDPRISSFQREIGLFMEGLGNKVEYNVLGKLSGKQEIDIFVPNINLAIECNGVYWHSENSGKRSMNYHLRKTLDSTANNTQLVHILDTEWHNAVSKDIICSKLTHIAQKTPNIRYARKCQVKVLTTTEARNFLSENHLQGYTHGTASYGLFHENTLVMAMTFGKSRYNEMFDWELIRLATKKYHNVVGGASKLFNHFINTMHPKNILSYCDLRWSIGNVYPKLGFTLSHTSKPGYSYVTSRGELLNRTRFQKHKLKYTLGKFDANLTEWENMQLNGYDRIWDCGNLVYVWRD